VHLLATKDLNSLFFYKIGLEWIGLYLFVGEKVPSVLVVLFIYQV